MLLIHLCMFLVNFNFLKSSYRQLTYIQKRCHSEPAGPGVAALTSNERTKWAEVGILRQFFPHKKNKNVTTGNTSFHLALPFPAFQIREYLVGLDPKNLAHLEKIQKSVFTICLDDSSPHATPENYTEVAKDFWQFLSALCIIFFCICACSFCGKVAPCFFITERTKQIDVQIMFLVDPQE